MVITKKDKIIDEEKDFEGINIQQGTVVEPVSVGFETRYKDRCEQIVDLLNLCRYKGVTALLPEEKEVFLKELDDFYFFLKDECYVPELDIVQPPVITKRLRKLTEQDYERMRLNRQPRKRVVQSIGGNDELLKRILQLKKKKEAR